MLHDCPPFAAGWCLMLCGLIGRRGEPPAECGHLLASPYEKLADVGVLGRDAQIELDQAVCFRPAHKAVFPEPVQLQVSFTALLPQNSVGQRPHRLVCMAVGVYIAVTGWIPGADIDLGIWICLVSIDNAGGAQKRFGMAFGAGKMCLFHIVHLLFANVENIRGSS